MTQFSLTTTWLIDAPIEAVWDAIHDSQRLPPWWPYVVHLQESVRSESGGVGNVHQPWLQCLVLLSRWAMKWNHNALMLAGGQRLARHVRARLLGMKEDA